MVSLNRVIIFGVFDLTHYGHYEKFKRLKDMGYYVHVGVVTDEFTMTYKRKPIMSTMERLKNIEACKWADEVFISKGEFVDDVENHFKINTLAVGGDWDLQDYKTHMGFTDEWLENNDIKLVQLPYTAGVSTSNLIERCR